MAIIVPNSWGAQNRPSRFLREFNPCHDPKDGQFAAKSSGNCGPGAGLSKDQEPPKPGRKVPIKVSDIDHAVSLILKGEVVELPDVRRVNTVISKLAIMARDAKSKGQDAPYYNLCNVSVPGTNLFCAQKVTNAENPEGIERLEMPQLGGKPRAGSEADKLPRNPWDPSEVDGAAAFVDHLKTLGIGVAKGTEPVSQLKASQNELVGAKVAEMMVDTTFDPAKNPIFVARDHYVVDGHHRWAAVVGRDAEDGTLGNKPMNVIRVDAPISELLHIANLWSEKFGILPAAGKRKKAKSA